MKIMETIKFRAWDNSDKDNHYMLGPYDLNDAIFNHKDIRSLPLMQFTGLTDKNGKEIYENDLVRILAGHIDNKERVFQIVYAMGCFSLEPLDLIGLTTLGYYFKLCVENGVFKHWKECDGSVFEVIGNIHENPELL